MRGWQRWAVLVAIAVLLVLAVFGWTRSSPEPGFPPPPPPPPATSAEGGAFTEAPRAAPPDPGKRERKRFARNDRDDDGLVSREEYLQPRRGSFERMDLDGDGRVDFTEYSVKQRERFAASDCDADALLTPEEFASTATRRDAPEPDC